MFVNEACPLFLAHCRDERRLSANTLAAYGQDLKEFRARFVGTSVALVTGEDLVRYASYLREERRLAPATIKRRIACLKGLFGWLRRRKVVAADPFRDVDVRVRVPDRLLRCLSSGEAKSLFEAAGGAPVVTRLAVRLLLATGARVGELAGLRIGDLDLSDGTVRVVGKGDRQRRAFLANAALIEDLASYVRTDRSSALPDDRLLETRPGMAQSAASIRSRVKGLGRVAGLKRTVTPHMLRHTAATMLVESGVDIRLVQKVLGHRSISTTQIYTHVSDRALREAIVKADICSRMAA